MKRMNTYLNKKLFVSKWHYTITKEFCPRVRPGGIIFHNDSYSKHLKKQSGNNKLTKQNLFS